MLASTVDVQSGVNLAISNTSPVSLSGILNNSGTGNWTENGAGKESKTHQITTRPAKPHPQRPRKVELHNLSHPTHPIRKDVGREHQG